MGTKVPTKFGEVGWDFKNWKLARGRQMSRSLNTSKVLTPKEGLEWKPGMRAGIYIFGVGKGNRDVEGPVGLGAKRNPGLRPRTFKAEFIVE